MHEGARAVAEAIARAREAHAILDILYWLGIALVAAVTWCGKMIGLRKWREQRLKKEAAKNEQRSSKDDEG